MTIKILDYLIQHHKFNDIYHCVLVGRTKGVFFSLCGQNGDFTRGILGNTGLVHFLGLLCTICEIISLLMVNVSQSKLYCRKPIHVSSIKDLFTRLSVGPLALLQLAASLSPG